jgi:hypothetical protein
MPGKIIYCVVRLTPGVAEVEELTPTTMERSNEVVEAHRYKASAAAACKSKGGHEAGYAVIKITMSNKPEDEGFVWATMYQGQAGRLTMGIHGNERGAVGTKERGLKQEADLGIADGDPFEICRIPLL